MPDTVTVRSTQTCMLSIFYLKFKKEKQLTNCSSTAKGLF